MKTVLEKLARAVLNVGAFLAVVLILFFCLGALTYVVAGKTLTITVSIGTSTVMSATTPSL